jgi:hypothetical protein
MRNCFEISILQSHPLKFFALFRGKIIDSHCRPPFL